MLYTSNLLKRYISLEVDIEEIARELTLKTCEVEEIHHRIIPDLVVIGKVTEKSAHPDADKLSVCQVDCGSKGIFQICCGATNVDAGMFVPVALPGCFLPSLNLTIEPREMRGQASNGMICSKAELGIPENLEEKRIWMLQSTTKKTDTDFDDITDTDVGLALTEKYPWLTSWTIDVENKTITHRPDLFGHFGLSNELQAIFSSRTTFSGGKMIKERMRDQSIFELLDQATACSTEITVESELVYSYVLLALSNTNTAPSDIYLRCILHDLGLSPRSNWVDFSNAFMYLTGQPIHCFDADTIQGNITLRQAKEGEQFIDLFDTIHTLTTSDVVICDEQGIVALAGIIGGKDSGVTKHTKNILVEIANFNDVQLRKTAMRLGLRTDAQVRFEKEINPLYSLHASMMLIDELKYFGKSLGAYTLNGMSWWVNDSAQIHVTQSISLDTLAVEKMLFGSNGEVTHIHDKDILDILLGLGCRVSDDWQVSIPLRRGPSDIECEADLIEEIARMYGFHNIPEIPYKDTSKFVPFTAEVQQQRLLEELLTGTLHYDQIETYPWLHTRWIDILGYETTDSLFTMRDLDSVEQKYLRSNLTASLLEVLEKNAHFVESGRVFDSGKTWLQGREIPEHTVLGLLSWKKEDDNRAEHTFLDVRSHITEIMNHFCIRGRIEYIPTEDTLWHPKQQLEILVNKQVIGMVVTIHPSLAQALKLPKHTQASIAHIDLTLAQEFITEKKKGTQATYASLQDQWIEKDISFVLDQDQPFGIITDALKKVREIDSVEVFDLYQGEHLPEHKKSIAVRYTLHTPSTKDAYTPDQLAEIMQKAIQAGEKTGASLR